MYRIERPNRLPRKGLTCAIDDRWTYPQNVPVRRRCRQVRSSVGRIGFRQLTKRGSADEHSLALDDGKV